MKLRMFPTIISGVLSATMAFASLSVQAALPEPTVPSLPSILPPADRQGRFVVDIAGHGKRSLTLVAPLQEGLVNFIREHGNPIASVVMVDVTTGEVLAMAQGEDPRLWGSATHTALYEGFPAASLFKMVTSAAAVELAALDPEQVLGLTGGCADVHPQGVWLKDVPYNPNHMMSLSRAFAHSCNGFFARLTVKYLGLGALNQYAERLGWGREIGSDFQLPVSPIYPPPAMASSIHTVGRYAAGFGMVGMSAMHAAWLNLMIARNGRSVPLRVFADGREAAPHEAAYERLLSQQGSEKLRLMMHHTVMSGTASSAFRNRAYRKLKAFAGGKTGTLTGQAPKGLTTWFAGLMPYDQPQVVVSAVVVNGPRWVIKGSQLAAEAFRLWDVYQGQQNVSQALPHPSPKNRHVKS